MSCASRKGRPLTKKPLNPISKRRKKKEGYTKFYEEQIVKYDDRRWSMESGEHIPELGTVNIAHIFPKQKYKSISRHSDNIIIFTWAEHTRFDTLLGALDFKALEKEFPNSWGIICKRVVKLLHVCSEAGKLRRAFEEYLGVL